MEQLIRRAVPLMLALCSVGAFGQQQTTSAKSAEAELKQIESDWTDAQKTRNVEKLREILADAWVGIGPDGTKSDKAKAIEDSKSQANSLDSIELGPITVRVFGNTAIVTGSDTEKSKEHGADSSGKYIWTDVFVRQNGQWRAVASQSAKVPG